MAKKLLYKLWLKTGQKYRTLDFLRESAKRQAVSDISAHLFGNREHVNVKEASRICSYLFKDGFIRRKGTKKYAERSRKIDTIELTMKGQRVLEYVDNGYADRERIWEDRFNGTEEWLGHKYNLSQTHVGRIIRERRRKTGIM